MDVREKLVELLLQEDNVCEPSDCKYCGVKGGCGYYRTADRLIANGVTVQEWISVNDRLPEKHDRFICTYKFNSNIEMQFVGVLDYYASDQYPHWQHESAGVIVTHWMPLPEPPKGE